MLFLQTNPGKVFISGLTSGEIQFVQNLYNLPYQTGDILYYDGTNLNRLGAGNEGDSLKISGGLPTWNASATNTAYTHVQTAVSSTWNIVHNLDSTAPVINIFDEDGYAIEPESIFVVDKDNITVTFGDDVSGKAVIVVVGGSSGGGAGTVTSVAMTVPTGLSVSGSPITSSGTLAISLASGYIIPTSAALALKLENITGYIQQGSNVTITGTGTLLDPYVINASGGGGGGSAQDLQSVLDEGNEAEDQSIKLKSSTTDENVEIAPEAITLGKDTYKNQIATATLTGNRIQTLQDKSGVLAHLDDIPSLAYGTSQQIPYMNSAGTGFEYSSGISYSNGTKTLILRRNTTGSNFPGSYSSYRARGTDSVPENIESGDMVYNTQMYGRVDGSDKFLGSIRSYTTNATNGSENIEHRFINIRNGSTYHVATIHERGLNVNVAANTIDTQKESALNIGLNSTFNSDNSHTVGKGFTVWGAVGNATEKGTAGTYSQLNIGRIGSIQIDADVSTTYTTASGLYLSAPIAGTNATFTNTYTLFSDGRIRTSSMFIVNTPTSAGDATRKDYVDNQVATKEPLKVKTRIASIDTLSPDASTAQKFSIYALDETALSLGLPTNLADQDSIQINIIAADNTTFTPNAGYIFTEGNDAPAILETGYRYQFIIDRQDDSTEHYFISWLRFEI